MAGARPSDAELRAWHPKHRQLVIGYNGGTLIWCRWHWFTWAWWDIPWNASYGKKRRIR